MEIFKKKIHLREYVCSSTGGKSCCNNKVNLYIYASGFCPAKCSFCPGFNSKNQIDYGKLKESLIELHNKKVINRIGITGGEPLANLGSLNNILQIISDVCNDEYHISINTSGINLPLLRTIDCFSSINDVHISRHSEDDIENNKIFGIKVSTSEQIRKETELTNGIFSLSCNLIAGYIDSASKLQRYLDAAIQLGVYQVGFVSLMNKTDICNDLFVDYEEITSHLMVNKGFLFELMLKDKISCKCENFTYYNDFGQIPFYLRRNLGGKADCVKAFIFDQNNNLITNFGKDDVLL